MTGMRIVASLLVDAVSATAFGLTFTVTWAVLD